MAEAIDLSAPALALVSAGFGAALAYAGSYGLWIKQRDWQRNQVRFERQLEVVRVLDTGLVEAERRIFDRSLADDENRWDAAHREWGNSWVQASPFLTDHEVRERYESVGTLLSELSLYEADTRRRPMMRRAASQAIQNARLGIAYFGREEDLPPRCFPAPQDLLRLLGEGDPEPFERGAPLAEWLKAHPSPPWHPRRDGESTPT